MVKLIWLMLFAGWAAPGVFSGADAPVASFLESSVSFSTSVDSPGSLFPSGQRQENTLGEASAARHSGFHQDSWANAVLGAELMDGVVIPPGGEFSFLHAIRPGRDRFVPGLSISAGRLVPTLGGGYCQASTTLYLAALQAGLEVLERYAHSYYVEEESYYAPGFDAAVSEEAGKDLRLLNPYSFPVWLRAIARAGTITVKVQGQGRGVRRWLKVEARRLRKRMRQKPSSQPPGTLLRRGYDGWIARRWLNEIDAEGRTRSAYLGTDHYHSLSEWIAEP